MTRPAKRARLEKGEKGLLIASVFFVILVGGLGWWWDAINRDPVVNIPTPVMPNPNALDYYVKAGNALVWRDTGYRFRGALRRGELPSLDAGMKPAAPRPPSSTPTMTLKEVEAGVKKDYPALALLREGFNFEYREPTELAKSSADYNYGQQNPGTVLPTLYSPLPHYLDYREISAVLRAEGYLKAIHNDWSGATDSYLDCMELGATCGRNSPFTGSLVGIFCQTVGRAEMWRAIDHLDAAAAQVAIKRLKSIIARQPPFSDTLEVEKMIGQMNLMETFRLPRKKWPRFFGTSRGPIQVAAIHLSSKREVMANYTAYMDAAISNARKPYVLQRSIPESKDALSQILTCGIEYVRQKLAINDTYNNLLLTMLALRAYRQEHGAYPATLADLCPTYLTKIPDDPFGRGGPFNYKVTGKTYLLYSIGPDGMNDGGTPCTDTAKKAGAAIGVASIQPDSRGDIVAGVNVW